MCEVVVGLYRIIVQCTEKLCQELENYWIPTHTINFNAYKVLYCGKSSYKHSASVAFKSSRLKNHTKTHR